MTNSKTATYCSNYTDGDEIDCGRGATIAAVDADDDEADKDDNDELDERQRHGDGRTIVHEREGIMHFLREREGMMHDGTAPAVRKPSKKLRR